MVDLRHLHHLMPTDEPHTEVDCKCNPSIEAQGRLAVHSRLDGKPLVNISAEINNCPIHGAVDKDHRCPEFDGVLRDAWTGDTLDDSRYADRSHRRDGPSNKYLGMTENGTQFIP